MEYTVFIERKIHRRILWPKIERIKIGFLFNINFWQRLSNYTQLAPMDWGYMKDESFLRKVLYCACEQWHFEYSINRKLTEDIVNDWVENHMTMKQGQELIETFFKSKIGGESIDELIPKALASVDEVKKKSHGQRSKILQSE